MLNNIFVYGTLKPGHVRWPVLQQHAESVTPSYTYGRMLDLGSYPGAIFSTCEGKLHGVTVEIFPEDLNELLLELDAIEGVDHGLFTRTKVTTVLETGERVKAYAYEYGTIIPSGRWDSFLDTVVGKEEVGF